MKAAILMGDDRVPCLIVSSVYDTKPVNYLSMADVSYCIHFLFYSRSAHHDTPCKALNYACELASYN